MEDISRWLPPGAPLTEHELRLTRMPAAIKLAIGLFVVNGLGIPLLSKVWVAPTPFDGQEGALMVVLDWMQTPFMLAVAAFMCWRRPWPRVVVALLVGLEIGDYVIFGSVAARFASFPRSAIRDGIDFLLQAVAVALLFAPAASRWYRGVPRARKISGAAPSQSM